MFGLIIPVKLYSKLKDMMSPEQCHVYHASFPLSPPAPIGINLVILSQTTNFRVFQTERVCRKQFQI